MTLAETVPLRNSFPAKFGLKKCSEVEQFFAPAKIESAAMSGAQQRSDLLRIAKQHAKRELFGFRSRVG
jgi:hypothetical protein